MVWSAGPGVGLASPRSGGSGRWLPGGPCHSVGGMFLLRDLVSARTWLAMTQHLVGLFIGFAAIFIFTFGLGFGAGFVFLGLVGIPILGVTLRLADWFARAGYRWGVVPRLRAFTERATWAEIGYGLLRLPFSAVALTLSVAVWAAGLAAVALPGYGHDLPNGGPTIGSDVYRSTADLVVSVIIGVVLLLAAPQLTR